MAISLRRSELVRHRSSRTRSTPSPKQACSCAHCPGNFTSAEVGKVQSALTLIDLNHCIVARLRFLHQMRAHVEMLEFKIGDRVTFQPPGQGPLEGMLTRYNKKTVTVITDDGRQWNVSPAFLSKAVPSKSKNSGGSNVVLLGKC